MNIKILESTLLLILLTNILRSGNLTNQFLLISLAVLVFIFLFFSFLSLLKFGEFYKTRVLIFALIVLLLWGFMLSGEISKRKTHEGPVHDGAILTEGATKAVVSGKNPYAVNYKEDFRAILDKPLSVVYDHYMYSPFMFLVNVPFYLFFDSLFDQLLQQKKTLFFRKIVRVFHAGLR